MTPTGDTLTPPPASTTAHVASAARPRLFLGPVTRLFARIRRRPGRALLGAVVLLLAAALVVVAVTGIWFETHLRKARTELDKGHNSEAIRHLKACALLAPDSREVLLLSARATRRAGSWEEAEDLLNRCSQLYGEDDPLVFERLLHRAARGEIEAAGPALQSRIQMGGGETRVIREALVTGLVYRFRWGEASRFLEAWLGETPDDTLALIQAGKFMEQQQGYDDAVRMYRRILELDPEHLEARLRLATILVTRRRGDEAAPELTVLRSKLPDHPEVMVLWARTLAMLGRTEESRRAIDDCLRIRPDYAAALLEKGSAALVDGDEAVAEESLAQAVKLDPGNLQAHTQYALVLSRRRKSEAEAEYAKARQLEADSDRIGQIIRGPLQERPNDPALHHEIGSIALRSGLVTEAIRWFKSALQVNPDHAPSHRSLAAIYHALDNPGLAAMHNATAQQLDKKH